MFEFELELSQCQLFKKDLKKNLIKNLKPYCEFTDIDRYLFGEGTHKQLYKKFGSHVIKNENEILGTYFCVYAPHAKSVSVVGDFNSWQGAYHEMINDHGIWSLYIPKLKSGETYKYEITTSWGDKILKADPYAFYAEQRPNTASIIYDMEGFEWTDENWVEQRKKSNIFEQPLNIYELHLGSWRRNEELVESEIFHSYAEIADDLINYVLEHSYTHIELMPLYEHPFDGSWGYQATGYYAASSRYGEPKDLMMFINRCHEAGIGVIMDWVPGHFCKDEHGLYKFDGTATYEYTEEWKAENKGWGTANFDLGRPEVRSFLISNAFYWIEEFHFDGLRVDAVANMLYLSYGREEGEWKPNADGSADNRDSIEFLKCLNKNILKSYPNIIMAAEESTAWPKVSHPVKDGGLGFNFKWNMGWMNDTLKYVELDPIYRKYNHSKLNFSMMYNYSENFILPISHDEVVHGKKSLVDKMWGDYWNKFAGFRLYLAYMIGHPGKKLTFMGSEFAQFIEWREYEQLEWKLINEFEMHKKSQQFTKELNNFYKDNKALWELDYDPSGFTWIDADNNEQSILSFIRSGKEKKETLVFICNFTPIVHYDFRIGVPYLGEYKEVFNTDDKRFGGSGQAVEGMLIAENKSYNNQPYSLKTKVPPMSVSIISVDKIVEINIMEGINIKEI